MGLPNGHTEHPALTQHADPMPVCSIGPAHRRDGDRVMAKVHKDVNVLPVVEGVGVPHVGALNEPVKTWDGQVPGDRMGHSNRCW